MAHLEALEPRTLLSVAFANLGYTDPFPAAGTLGQPTQSTPNIYTDSFADQFSSPTTGVRNDHYWNGWGSITRTLPTWLQGTAGLQQMSVEFWLKVNVGSNTGWGTIMALPGFSVTANWNWSSEPAGVL
ncbi:MAG: hypothetical protein WCI73_18455, partial [Phycisphaerae bacterium]